MCDARECQPPSDRRCDCSRFTSTINNSNNKLYIVYALGVTPNTIGSVHVYCLYTTVIPRYHLSTHNNVLTHVVTYCLAADRGSRTYQLLKKIATLNSVRHKCHNIM